MRMLVKIYPSGQSHLNAAHIPGPQSRPLCNLKINPQLWEVQDLEEAQYRIICYHCRRKQRMLGM